jgi:hypothetical protein
MAHMWRRLEHPFTGALIFSSHGAEDLARHGFFIRQSISQRRGRFGFQRGTRGLPRTPRGTSFPFLWQSRRPGPQPPLESKPIPRSESLVAATVQWADRIMRKIDNVFGKGWGGQHPAIASHRYSIRLTLRRLKMTLDDFRQSLTAAEPPAQVTLALAGLWWDAKGDWTKAHESAQQDEGPEGSWVHAYLHRKEGDLGNALYWYGRAGKPVCREPLDAEWLSIARGLLG